MHIADPVHLRSWRARLALDYECRGPRTVLASRSQDGPLVVQRPFYPEGDTVCHTLVVHPPAGIAGGDDLELAVRAGADACVLLTTPGASRWYRSAGPWARQSLAIDAAAGACVEWLPQEIIVFDGALADIRAEVRLAGSAVYIGWEVLCLGRTGSGERFARGDCRAYTRIWRDDVPIWYERARIEAGGVLARAPAGLAGHTVCGTMLAAAPGIGRELLAACRAEQPSMGDAAVTLLPDLLVARYLGDSCEAARHHFVRLWRRLRPALCGRASVEPRIWNT